MVEVFCYPFASGQSEVEAILGGPEEVKFKSRKDDLKCSRKSKQNVIAKHKNKAFPCAQKVTRAIYVHQHGYLQGERDHLRKSA